MLDPMDINVGELKKKTEPNIQDLNTITRIYLSDYTTPLINI